MVVAQLAPKLAQTLVQSTGDSIGCLLLELQLAYSCIEPDHALPVSFAFLSLRLSCFSCCTGCLAV